MKMTKEETVDAEYQLIWCSAACHAELIEEIRITLTRIRDVKSSKSSTKEEKQLSLVRMDGGV